MKTVGTHFPLDTIPAQSRRVAMRRVTFARRAASVVLLAASLHWAPALAQEWMLMPREGECHDLTQALRHRFEDFPPVATPGQLVEALRARGAAAKATPVEGTAQAAMTIEAPELRLSLIIARRQLCRQFARPVQ